MTGPATGAPTGSAWRDGVPHVLRANGLLLLGNADDVNTATEIIHQLNDNIAKHKKRLDRG